MTCGELVRGASSSAPVAERPTGSRRACRISSRLLRGLLGVLILTGSSSLALAQKFIPRGQEKPPGPPLSPQEAMQKMTVPPGFRVELVASEPDIVNPVAMTFDERGRVWITESLEYPRSSAGPGRDRVKVLEDTDGDGRMDKVTVFAEGLNIPSGIAVGHGGVWVANAPDLLFLQDTNGDGKADRQEVIVTGFGRTDTHELPNSLVWGPDGWLYGLNGVFNHSHVVYPKTSPHYRPDHPGWKFTCALFRIHPQTRQFQLFCEGTSNPWGVAFDLEGSAFVSACVIDHLWHLVETGYYHRQGGPYPPFTWKIESIVKHKHQKAAYCGIHFFDSDAYPPEYREKLYMGNIHGGCINVDQVRREGSTYFGTGLPDFFTANDVWCMPVSQKTGPDGSLYILDWYDQYHCYQDARRDPEGIERAKGRLYRIRYQDTPRAPRFDLARETGDQLIARLHSPNVYFRDIAQRILVERLQANSAENAALTAKLQSLVLQENAPRKARMHALWVLVGGGPLSPEFHSQLLSHRDSVFRSWGVRAAGNQGQVRGELQNRIIALARDEAPDVQLQVAIAARKLAGVDPLPLLYDVLSYSRNDPLLPRIVWQNLHPLLEEQSDRWLTLLEKADRADPARWAPVAALLPRVVERVLGRRTADPAPVVRLLALVAATPGDTAAARQCLSLLAGRVQTGEIQGPQLDQLRSRLQPVLSKILSGSREHPLYFDAAQLAVSWKDPVGLSLMQETFQSAQQGDPLRVQALNALLAARHKDVLATAVDVFSNRQHGSLEFRGQVIAALGRIEDPAVAQLVLSRYKQLEPELQPRVIELLTQRTSWSRELLGRISQKELPVTVLNENQVRKMLATKDAELVKLVRSQWGTVRETRNPQREEVIGDMRTLLRNTPGDAVRGQEIFKKVCGQCHKIHGEGQEVGPDITLNGRSSFEQLLSNVFDPSLVIGASYQARTVVTTQGRTFSGLVVEDSEQRIVLKVQGGKLETIPRGEVEESKLSELSLMPEGLEKQLKPQEIADLFSFLTLDRPPRDPQAKRIPGAPLP